MLRHIDTNQLKVDPFSAIGKEWMLISAGNKEKYNTMTASWGSLGVLWGKNVSNIFIRPQRYTLEFVDSSEYYSLSFFGNEHKRALAYCGAHSGRDVDKAKQTGFTPVFDLDAPYFSEAKLVLICRKLYKQQLDPGCFIDHSINAKNYPDHDYHFHYVGEIVKVLADG